MSSATEPLAPAAACGTAVITADAAVGRAFAAAVARRDFDELATLLHPEVDFRALTPRRTWEAATPDEVLDVLRTWFGPATVEQVLAIDSSAVGDRQHVAYRLRGVRDDAPFVIEQQAYFDVRDGRLAWVRLVCSGFRPPAAPAAAQPGQPGQPARR